MFWAATIRITQNAPTIPITPIPTILPIPTSSARAAPMSDQERDAPVVDLRQRQERRQWRRRRRRGHRRQFLSLARHARHRLVHAARLGRSVRRRHHHRLVQPARPGRTSASRSISSSSAASCAPTACAPACSARSATPGGQWIDAAGRPGDRHRSRERDPDAGAADAPEHRLELARPVPVSHDEQGFAARSATTRKRPRRSGSRSGREAAPSRSRPIGRGPNTTCWRCFPIPPASSMSATCATTRWATWSRATSARRASTCCTRWAGTHSVCRPRTPRSRAANIRRAGRYDEHRRHARAS